MKKSICTLAYKAVSGLSNLTGGASLLVKCKVALAAVVLGLSAASTTGCGETSCYEPVATCYDPVAEYPEDDPQDGTEEEPTDEVV